MSSQIVRYKRAIKLMFRRLGILIVALSVSLSWAPELLAQASDSSDSSEYLIKAVVKRLKWGMDLKDLKDCKILFVGASERAHVDDLVQIVKSLPILTVGETPGFAERGGVIRFVLEDNRVRFEVNVDAARQADLTISSRLLTLARIIQQAPPDTRKPG